MARIVDTLLNIGNRVGFLRPFVNRIAINLATGREVPRPHPYSLWTPNSSVRCCDEEYVTWAGLVDRGYTGRHLPPEPKDKVYPDPEEVVRALFLRPKNAAGEDITRESKHTTALFCFFAQWFTDSFLRTHPTDSRLNTSNHEIDLCGIYGLTEATADALREKIGGRMKVERHATGEYPPRLYENGVVRPEFAGLGLTSGAAAMLAAMPAKTPQQIALKTQMQAAVEGAMSYPAHLPDFVRTALSWYQLPPSQVDQRIADLYATGVDRGSNTILYAAFNALFLREHNRIARLLEEANRGKPHWDDDRLFQTARNVNMVQALKLVVEEYIHHLAGEKLPFKLDRSFAEERPWYHTNRIAIEFVLLYRWHPMIPNTLRVDGRTIDARDYRWNNALLEQIGIEKLIAEASMQPAGSMRLRNTPGFMEGAEIAGLKLSREHRVKSFNAYRKRFGYDPYRTHEELTGETVLAAELRRLYPNIDDVEFFVGLIAEAHPETSSFGETLFTIVAVDAFSQIFTNPLLAKEVYEKALGPEGMKIVDDTKNLEQIVRRNAQPGTPVKASFKL
jgi:prostaglandin-endoperoxide synthase 2